MRSKQLEAIIAATPTNFADPEADYLAVRKMMAGFHGHPVSEDVTIKIKNLGGVNVGWLWDEENKDSQRIAFHCHGGAFVSCPLDVYYFYAEMIAKQVGVKAVIPDYRLAPEHPYPAAHDDCFAAYKGLIESGTDPKQICLLGESCGGSLALSILLRARDEDIPMPACFVSLTGWFDLTVADKSFSQLDPFLTPEWVRNRAKEYLAGNVPPINPYVSPAYAQLTGLPPMYLQLAQYDTMREGTLQLAANAARDGVEVLLESWPGMIHGWHGLVNAGVPESLKAWQKIKDYVESYIPVQKTSIEIGAS